LGSEPGSQLGTGQHVTLLTAYGIVQRCQSTASPYIVIVAGRRLSSLHPLLVISNGKMEWACGFPWPVARVQARHTRRTTRDGQCFWGRSLDRSPGRSGVEISRASVSIAERLTLSTSPMWTLSAMRSLTVAGERWIADAHRQSHASGNPLVRLRVLRLTALMTSLCTSQYGYHPVPSRVHSAGPGSSHAPSAGFLTLLSPPGQVTDGPSFCS